MAFRARNYAQTVQTFSGLSLPCLLNIQKSLVDVFVGLCVDKIRFSHLLASQSLLRGGDNRSSPSMSSAVPGS